MSETIENTGRDRGNQKNETCDTNEHCKFDIKCGEIIWERKNDFIIICSDCGRMFEQFEAFGKHYFEQHTVPSGYGNRAIDSEGPQQSQSLDHSKVKVIDDEYIESRDEYMTATRKVFDEDHAEEMQCETADSDPNGPHGNEEMDSNDETEGQFLIVQFKLEEEDAVGDNEETTKTEPLCLKLHMNLESSGPKEDTTSAEMLQLQIKEEIGVEETVNWYSPENSASKKSKAESQDVTIKNEPPEKKDVHPINEIDIIPKLEPIDEKECDSRMVDDNVANFFDNSSKRHANTYSKCIPETQTDGDALLIPLCKLRAKHRLQKKTSLQTNHASNKVVMKDLRHTKISELPNISKACKSKDYLVPHRLTTIQSGKLGCDYCESKFNNASQQRAHRHTCLDRIKGIRCKECPRRFKHRKWLNRHVENCHKIEKISIILCQYCDEKVENFNVLKEHILSKHNENDSFSDISEDILH